MGPPAHSLHRDQIGAMAMTKGISAPAANSSAVSAKKLRSSRTYFAGVVAGGILVAASFGNAAWDIGSYGVEHSDKLKEFVSDLFPGWMAQSGAPLPSTMYVTMYNDDGHDPQTWKLSFSGTTEYNGTVLDEKTKSTGLIHGYRRGDAIVLEYASTSPDRPGFGAFVLRRYASIVADDPLVYIGTAIVHDCACADGTIVTAGRIISVPAVLSARPTPPNIVDVHFRPLHPQELNGVWPADLQQSAER
jgi:hypothetical protein